MRLTRFWRQRTLAQQFMFVSLLILVSSMIGVGWWVGREIEHGVIERTAATTALYVDSFVTPRVQDLAPGNALSPQELAVPAQLLQESPLGQQVVSFKIWSPGGRVIQASDPRYVGQVFPPSAHLRDAMRGEVHSEISDLDEAENAHERERWPRLLETYIPLFRADSERVIGVAEFYQTVDDLEQDIAAAQRRSWLAVGAATLAMYLLLNGLVRRGSNTIVRQRRDLEGQVDRLTALLAENQALHERVRLAATRTTTLNERFLRRLSAELHDGPAQQIALALLRLDSVGAYCAACPGRDPAGQEDNTADLDRIQTSVRHALQEIRAISSGLRLPELGALTLSEAVARAVRMHERRTGTTVLLECAGLPDDIPLPVKITVYRVVEEALNNAYRHGGGVDQRVALVAEARALRLEIADHGPGFNGLPVTDSDQHLGLIGMRERIESLGGFFAIESEAGRGTTVTARIPLQASGGGHERTNPDGHRGRSSASARRRRAHLAR